MSWNGLTISTGKPAYSFGGASPIDYTRPFGLLPCPEGDCLQSGQHFFMPLWENPGGQTLLVGFHFFGTFDEPHLPEPLMRRLLCHAVLGQLPDEGLLDAEEMLIGIYKFYRDPANSSAIGSWNSLPLMTNLGRWCERRLRPIGDRIGALSVMHDAEQAMNEVTVIRRCIAGCLDAVDGQISLLAGRIEVGDLSSPDADAIRREARSRRLPDDGPLSCDPDDTSGE